jgi:cytochrome P450
MIDLIWTGTKMILGIFGAFILLLIYRFVVRPVMFRRKYAKYSNVGILPDFIPVLADGKPMIKDLQEGKAVYDNWRQQAKLGKDLWVFITGDTPAFRIGSPKARQEMMNLIPTKIDKKHREVGLFRTTPKTFSLNRTTKRVVGERKAMFDTLGLSAGSKYTLLTVQKAREVVQKFKPGDTKVFPFEGSLLNFRVFSNIIFGREIDEVFNQKIDFLTEDGKVQPLVLDEFYIKLVEAFLKEGFTPANLLFGDFITNLSFLQPFKRNWKNYQTFLNVFLGRVNDIKDQNCYYLQMKNDPAIAEEYLIDDLVWMFFAGSDTSAHMATSSLYYLKKNPQHLATLKKELEEHKLGRNDNWDETCTYDNIQN